MKLFLLRHAEARNGNQDHLREISSSGEIQILTLCKSLDSQSFGNLAHVWCSKYVRAMQTAELFCSEMKIKAPIAHVNGITPDDDPEKLVYTLSEISQFGSDLMIVSHNPFISKLASLLIKGSQYSVSIFFDTCTMACLELCEDPSHEKPLGVWAVNFLLSPQQLK